MAVLSTLATESGILTGAFVYGSHGGPRSPAGFSSLSAGLAWYMVAAMLLAASTGRTTILPTFEYKRAANVPGRRVVHAIELEGAEPGVKMGQ